MTDLLPQKSLTPPIPANETDRLAALHRYKILDTPPEAAFDRITTLAARLFKMPIALISLVDESRAWFKSCIGFNASEVSRNATLCSFAILTDEPLIIPDARLDDRFACNPFVQSKPGVRFYAGAPLLSHDGFNLGTLCLLDSQPHDQLTAEQQATLVDLAAMVVDELELRLAAHKIAQVDEALLEITQGVATVTGGAFFDALVQHFAKVLDTDYVYIGLVEGDDPKLLRTIATFAQGQIVDNLTYLLQDTPCWEVIGQRKICCYPRNVQTHFPNAPLLKPLSVESYIAAPFFDYNGTAIGLLGVMDGEPLENVHLAESLLMLFASRIATELERQQAEDALRESEERYRAFIAHSTEGIWRFELEEPLSITIDEHSQIEHLYQYAYLAECNQVMAQMYGFSSIEEIIGTRLGKLMPPSDPRNLDYLRAFIRSGYRLSDAESYEVDRFGNAKYFANNLVGIIQDRCLIRAWGNQRDISEQQAALRERKQAELDLVLSEERFRTLADNMSQFAWMANAKGWIFWYNRRWFEYTGTTLEEMQGWGWQQVHHPDHVARVVEHIRHCFETGEQWEDTFPLRGKDGVYRWFLSRAIPIRDEQGRILCWFGTNTDITDRKQAELQLQQQASELIKLNVAYKQTASKLSERNQELDGFVYTVSHDLKAPLRAIANLSQWLSDDLEGQLEAEYQHQLELLRVRVYRMEALIDGLLAYSRVGRTEIATETVDVGKLIFEILDSLMPPPTFIISVQPEMPTILAKRLLLSQVFSNLISNAIKHHDRPYGRLEIRAAQKGEYHEFSVADDGGGIAPKDHERVFGIFQTLKGRDVQESTGIGLSIVKKIIETEGGSIVLESDLGKGATFRFTWGNRHEAAKTAE